MSLKVKLSDIRDFPPSFWLLSIVCLAYYVAIFPFISLGQVFFIKKFDFTASNANFINGNVQGIDDRIAKDHDRDHFFGDRYDRQFPSKDRDLFTRSYFHIAKSIPIPFLE